MIPMYRLCGECHAQGKEERIGTQTAPLLQFAVGLMEDGLAHSAPLPRFAWKLWTRYHHQDDQLEPIPVRHEYCCVCFVAMVSVPGALDVLTQAEYRDEARAEHEQRQAQALTR